MRLAKRRGRLNVCVFDYRRSCYWSKGLVALDNMQCGIMERINTEKCSSTPKCSHAPSRLVMFVVVTLASRVCLSSSCCLHSPHRLLTMLTMLKTPTCRRMVTGRESSASLLSSSVVRRQGSRDMNRCHLQMRMNLASLQFVALAWVSSRPKTKSS